MNKTGSAPYQRDRPLRRRLLFPAFPLSSVCYFPLTPLLFLSLVPQQSHRGNRTNQWPACMLPVVHMLLRPSYPPPPSSFQSCPLWFDPVLVSVPPHPLCLCRSAYWPALIDTESVCVNHAGPVCSCCYPSQCSFLWLNVLYCFFSHNDADLFISTGIVPVIMTTQVSLAQFSSSAHWSLSVKAHVLLVCDLLCNLNV